LKNLFRNHRSLPVVLTAGCYCAQQRLKAFPICCSYGIAEAMPDTNPAFLSNLPRGKSFFSVSICAPQMVSAESLAFGRGITRKVQRFGGNRNIVGARR